MEYPIYERRGITTILITLYNTDEMITTDLIKLSGLNERTFYDRKKELEAAKLIKTKQLPKRKKEGAMYGRAIWISLTPKGKKVAEKLKEIKEIMEREG